MVSGAEELVSRVVKVKGRQGADLHLPVGVIVPFCARYHGCYRDVAVKMLDEEGRTSYIPPRTTDGAIGGHRVMVGNGENKKKNLPLLNYCVKVFRKLKIAINNFKETIDIFTAVTL